MCNKESPAINKRPGYIVIKVELRSRENNTEAVLSRTVYLFSDMRSGSRDPFQVLTPPFDHSLRLSRPPVVAIAFASSSRSSNFLARTRIDRNFRRISAPAHVPWRTYPPFMSPRREPRSSFALRSLSAQSQLNGSPVGDKAIRTSLHSRDNINSKLGIISP